MILVRIGFIRLNYPTRKTILDPKGWICSDVMNQSLQIIADKFPHINGLQMTNLAPIFDTKSDSWKFNKQFESILPPSVQIHHTVRDHWVFIFRVQR